MLNVATESAAPTPIPPTEPTAPAVIDTRYADYKIIRRNGAVVGFAPGKIAIAVTKAFIAVQGRPGGGVGTDSRAGRGADQPVVKALLRRTPTAAPSISRISRTRSNCP